MKNKLNYLFSLILVGFVTNIFAQASQLKVWGIPTSSQVNFVPTTAVVSSLPTGGSLGYSGFTGLYGDVAHNSMHDASGNLLFYIAENYVYDKDGDMIGVLDYDPSVTPSEHTYLSSEISIIPDIANCSKFYIVSGFKSNPNSTVNYKPHYAVLDMSLQNPNFPTNPLKKGVLQVNSFGGTLFALAGMPYLTGMHTVSMHIATSKLRTVGGTPHRYVFIANAVNIYRFKLTASGLSYDASSTPINTGSYSSSLLRGEMELIEDVPNNKYKIAVVATRTMMPGSSPGGFKVFTAELNYTTGALTSILDIMLPNPVPSTGTPPIPHGIEFSPNGRYLYITHETATGISGNVRYFDFTTSALNVLSIPSSNIYQFSQVELGYGHLISSVLKYPLYFESSNGLMALNDANTPTSGFTAVPFTNNSTFLPDQIDGEVYFPTCPTLTITGNIIMCAGSSNTLTASGSTSTYTWYPGGLVSPTLVVSPSSTTIYTVVSTVGCCTSSATIKVIVNPNTLSPDFVLSGTTIFGNPTDCRISAMPNVLTSWPTSSFWWEISEVDAATGTIPLAGKTMTNAQTWWYAPFISNNTFPGYDHNTTSAVWPILSPMSPYPSPYTGSGYSTNPAPGTFGLGKKYRITRATWGDCIPWSTVSRTISIGAPCKGCKTSNDLNYETGIVSYNPPMPVELMTPTNIQPIKLIDKYSVIISPNPNNGVFNVNTYLESVKDIYVYDIAGKVVYENKGVSERNINININDQPKGIYIVRVTDGKISATQKIIKE